MTPYSVDLRRRVLKDCDAGVGTKAVAQKYSVSESWVRKLKRQRRDTGSIDPLTATPGPRPSLDPHAEKLRELVRAAPGLSAAEYRDRLGVDVAAITVWRALRRLGLTFKKSPSGRPSKTGPTSPPKGRRGGRR